MILFSGKIKQLLRETEKFIETNQHVAVSLESVDELLAKIDVAASGGLDVAEPGDESDQSPAPAPAIEQKANQTFDVAVTPRDRLRQHYFTLPSLVNLCLDRAENAEPTSRYSSEADLGTQWQRLAHSLSSLAERSRKIATQLAVESKLSAAQIEERLFVELDQHGWSIDCDEIEADRELISHLCELLQRLQESFDHEQSCKRVQVRANSEYINVILSAETSEEAISNDVTTTQSMYHQAQAFGGLLTNLESQGQECGLKLTFSRNLRSQVVHQFKLGALALAVASGFVVGTRPLNFTEKIEKGSSLQFGDTQYRCLFSPPAHATGITLLFVKHADTPIVLPVQELRAHVQVHISDNEFHLGPSTGCVIRSEYGEALLLNPLQVSQALEEVNSDSQLAPLRRSLLVVGLNAEEVDELNSTCSKFDLELCTAKTGLATSRQICELHPIAIVVSAQANFAYRTLKNSRVASVLKTKDTSLFVIDATGNATDHWQGECTVVSDLNDLELELQDRLLPPVADASHTTEVSSVP